MKFKVDKTYILKIPHSIYTHKLLENKSFKILFIDISIT